jgi:hypothetical protein
MRLLRRATGVVAGWMERWSRGDTSHRAAGGGNQSHVAPAAAEQATTTETLLPDELTYGQAFLTPEGLELTVTGVEAHDSSRRHVVIDVQVTNVSEHSTTFENDFGVDAAGTAHRYTWVNSANYPGVLPGVATLAPGALLAGKVHVLLPEPGPEDLAMIRPTYLGIINSGCGGCNHAVTFLPRALWRSPALPHQSPST